MNKRINELLLQSGGMIVGQELKIVASGVGVGRSIKMNEQLMIKNKYDQIQKKLKSVQSELEWLQETCTHPNFDVKHKGDRGNYDPSCDRYWTEYRCPDCGKFWTDEK